MPWLMCTTGSPTFNSDKVLDQRVDVADLFLFAFAAGGRAGGEELGFGDELNAGFDPLRKPTASGATAIAKRSSLASNSASDATVGGSMRLSRSSSSRLSRRPSLSATISTRSFEVPTCTCSFLQRLGRAALDAQVGKRAGPGVRQRRPSSAPRTDSAACSPASAEELLGLQEQFFRRQDRPLSVVLQKAVALARVGPETSSTTSSMWPVQRHAWRARPR